eukprot:369229_1
MFIVIYVLIFFIILLKYLLCFCCINCKNKTCKKIINYFDREPFIKKSIFRMFLLYIGSVLSTLFQLMIILPLPNGEYIYYHAPDKYVEKSTLIICGVVIILITAIFIICFVIIFKQSPKNRFTQNNILRPFVKSFREKVWYWQFLIFIRRC